jgi:hypothetical protein
MKSVERDDPTLPRIRWGADFILFPVGKGMESLREWLWSFIDENVDQIRYNLKRRFWWKVC